MEKRKGPQVKTLLGSASGGHNAIKNSDLTAQLEHGTAQAVAEATVSMLAVAHPVIGVLYFVYKAAQFTYPIVKEGLKEYEMTGDTDKAAEKMAVETFKQTGKVAVGTAVEPVAGAMVDGTTSAVGAHVDNTTRQVATAAVAEAIDEVIEHYE